MEAHREGLQKQISNDIVKLKADILNLKELTQPVSSDETDEVSRMDSLMTKSVNDAALASAERRLAALEFALTRINNEDFGYCLECGEKIPTPRLLAMPEARHCVECAEELNK